jgi:2-keto-4-pentenoate hydratase
LPPAASDPGAIAQRFVTARLGAAPLRHYPGDLPNDLDQAYAIQDAAIALWPDAVGGWKVGRIPSPWRERYGEERLVGPIFSASIRRSIAGGVFDCPVFEGGFAAVEAEYVIQLGEDAPAAKLSWTADEARRLAASLHIGVEPASSPLESINRLGPAVVVSDFGNNAGLLVGPEVPRWRERTDESLVCEAFIDARSVGRGGAASIPGGPFAALAFALGRCARRHRPLRAGDFVSTGAASGIHDMLPGQSARLSCGEDGEILCRAVRAQPRGQPPAP